ncbi:hypothetical protein SAMN05216282_11275 [Cryobacterium psychrotolerans]|uniref:LysM domain-containing protein n=1 Tax=Cryobacterium psychrotolerans TaxID=386301 RepID=A0A1G9EJ62_9MICO|nr:MULTISPECIES: LysM peptidoglycan-binding domain-containing protein [Cryobacterium]TFD40729.1 hypothetical protein E3T33_14925 [Cryobacterium sp. TMT1-2-1]TFD88484.1 hypothetical protein E3T56_04605 [Cryobacterium psychrotolerans]SDK76128.1 hypothetical protein SAMN05216282_11275 [Cryobacterium psychrotolerans]
MNAAVSTSTHLRLTRRGRVVFTTLAALPLVAVALVVALNGGMASAEGASDSTGADTAGVGSVEFDYVTINPGQSLWQLAESLAPTSDPRDLIAEIVSLNQLTSESVQSGQRLALPAGL